MPKGKQKTLVILDTHALIHRAFHALPPFSAPNGEPVGAVYGVANVLFKIAKDFQPDYIAAAFDRPEPTFRHEAYEDYKGTRAEISPDIIPQFQRTKELLQAFGVATFEAAGYEADDILGTIVSHEHVKDKNLRIIIASGDLDAVQLVDGDNVVVYTLKKGIADTIVYNEAAVKERFGFPPSLLPDYKGLRGDTSDNIKGVPGIGEKTGCMLVSTFGSLEEIYKHLDDIRTSKAFRGKVADLLEEHKKDAFFSRELATIRRDVPISFSLDEARWGVFNKAKAAQFLQELNFKSLANRIPEPIEDAGVVEDSPQNSLFTKEEDSERESVSTLPAESLSEKGLSSLMKESELGWLPEGDGLLVTTGDTTWSISQEFLAKHEPEFFTLFQSPKIEHVALDSKKVLKMLWHMGSKAEPLFFDVSVAAWVLDPSLRDSLEVTAQLLLSTARDLAKRLKENKLEGVFRTIETPLIPMLARMEETGITVDASILNELSRELAKMLKAREKKIYKLAGEEFNINSPRQLSEILFTKLKIDTKGLRKTDSGVSSTRASELHKLKGIHPLIDEILRYREEAKLQSTYVTVLPKLIQEDGRIHTTYNQIGAVTGRLSSIDPNLQNIPIRTELGKGIRRAFIASKGYELLSFDYSQMELRLAASMANDKKMIAAFKSGQDIHAITASNVYHVPLEEVKPQMRRAAKTINFGVLYGMGPVSLAESLSISRKDASLFIAEYFKQFPKVKKYLEEMKQKALERGYVETLFGRRRYFPNMESMGWQARREAERMAINAPIQGSGADIIKMAIVKIGQDLKEYFEQDDLRLLLQVHDELLFEVKPKLRQELAPRIQHIMEQVCKLDVDLTVGVKHGSDWYSLV